MSWSDAFAGGVLGAIGGGAASAYGGYLAARHQQRLASVAAAKLIVAELLRNQIRLKEFEAAPLGTKLILKRSFRPERVAWQSHSAALTQFIDNDAFALSASAYVHIELAEIVGAGRENREQACEAVTSAVARLTEFVQSHEFKPPSDLTSDLRWMRLDEAGADNGDAEQST